MRVAYQKYIFYIHFKKPITFDTNPVFILRSVLGMNLHAMSCISKGTLCVECLYRKTCSYACIFETILPKENAEVPGRTRASHPFVLQLDTSFEKRFTTDALEFSIILFGHYTEYFPYIYGSFVRAGTNGLGKQRIPFDVTDIQTQGKSILTDADHIDTTVPALIWDSSERMLPPKNGEVLVQLLSPLRFKVAGAYSINFKSADFMMCLLRRMKTMCALYGESEPAYERYDAEKSTLRITQRALQWKDNEHYSSRQRTAMELGGITGTFTLAGTFSPTDLLLLEFAKLFGAGKNTNFGLGKIDYWTKWE